MRTKLEEDIRRCTEECQNQKTARENVDLALNSVNEKLKASEKVSRDLQATMDLLVSRSEGDKTKSSQTQSTLERENNKLLTRVRELESECRHLKVSTVSSKSSCVDPPQPSSDPRTTWLEQENDRLRQLSTSHEESMKAASDRLTSLQASLAKAENEKVANERRMQTQLNDLEEKLEEREEELAYLRQQVGDDSTAEREQQLMNRIDEDQAKIEQLVKLVDGSRKAEEALIHLEAQLKVEIAKTSAIELRNAELMQEKEEVLSALAIAQKSLSERTTQFHTRGRYVISECVVE
jgi:DNA repair exonuclease SbcCD ATPase subunit